MLGGIIGVWAGSKDETSQFFTSVLYPFVVDESIGISVVQLRPSTLWENPNDDVSFGLPIITNGSLVETITYKTYNESLAIDDVSFNAPTVLSGALNETITYKTYNESLAIDDVRFNVPAAITGTLTTTISYVSYDNANANAELVAFNNPTIISGTLT